MVGGSAETESEPRWNPVGSEVILVARNPDRLRKAADLVEARDTAAFDVTDSDALGQFFAGLSGPVDHVLVTGPGPVYGPLAELDHALVQWRYA